MNMDNLIIRDAQLNDYLAVENILKQVQELHVNLRPDIYKPMDVVMSEESYLESIKKDKFMVVEVEGVLCGLFILIERIYNMPTHIKRKIIYLDTMVIDKEYRNKGIGTKVFEYIKRYAKENKYDGIELQVNARNVVARKMYEKNGFTEKSINMEISNL